MEINNNPKKKLKNSIVYTCTQSRFARVSESEILTAQYIGFEKPRRDEPMKYVCM